MHNVIPIIVALKNTRINEDEKHLLQNNAIFGIILFARNIEDSEQLTTLVREIKINSLNKQIIISIDEEGGRVTRLRSFFVPLIPAKEIGDVYQKSKMEGRKLAIATYKEIAKRLRQFDITMCYAPVCDISYPQTHDVIGDRAFSDNTETIIELATIASDTLLNEGVYPVIKHIPGHGLAKADSHLELPIIDEEVDKLEQSDFAIFKALKHYPFAMSAHILYKRLDATNPITLSKKAISYIRNNLSFNNIVISDDITMKALNGDIAEITEKAFQAGCDIVLHCNGDMNEMLAIVEVSARRSRSFHLENFKKKS